MSKGVSRPHLLCSRCFVSSFCTLAKPIVDKLDQDLSKALQDIGILQLFQCPPLPQNIPVLFYMILCYNSKSDSFKIGSKDIKLTVNEVAMIIGLPNSGLDVEYDHKSYSSMTKKELKDKLLQITAMDHNVEYNDLTTLILHLLCNFFFPCSSNKIPEVYVRLSDPSEFSKYNWPKSIHEYLMSSLGSLSEKTTNFKGEDYNKRSSDSIGYLNGCSQILLIWVLEHIRLQVPAFPDKRPRIHRWANIKSFSLRSFMSLKATIKEDMVLESFENLEEDDISVCHIEEHIIGLASVVAHEEKLDEELPEMEHVSKKIKLSSSTPILLQLLEAIQSLGEKIVNLESKVDELTNVIADMRGTQHKP